MNSIVYLIVLLFVLSGCKEEEQQDVSLQHCTSCHSVSSDTNHQQPCISCHRGNSQAETKEMAHQGFIASPANPENLGENCGPCHKKNVAGIPDSLHFTLANSTNLFRQSFGAKDELPIFIKTPKNSMPKSKLQLADDLLRRRCFRCHPYSSGDEYPYVTHGTGCSSCHMAFSEGQAVSHRLKRPDDMQCLSCHYGNYVGFDYYGRFEHDLNDEYRTPYTTRNDYFRPYGVEYHQLQPDVHQLRGMLCIDCHRGQELMVKNGPKPSCKGCHSLVNLQQDLPALVELRDQKFILHGRDGKDHPIPLMKHPAHLEQAEAVSCQACHAQWTFNDFGKHFLRADGDDFDIWLNLSVQGNFEIETIIEWNNDFDNTELPPLMTDKLTGESEIGLWHKGYTMRRWETVLLGRDHQGIITTVRPMLDWYLSWIDEDENIRFDSVASEADNKGLRPYVPHTTGPAGMYYGSRIEQFLAKERAAAQKISPVHKQ